MKRIVTLYCLLAASALLFLAGCPEGGATASLFGLVSDGDGIPIAGVAIVAGTADTVTAADGRYEMKIAPSVGVKVTATRAGYVPTFDVVAGVAGQDIPVDFVLSEVGSSDALTDMDTTETVADDPRGTTVTFPAGSVVDAAGDPVSDATVEVTTSMPGDEDYTDTFPGLFVGTRDDADAAIESFGFVNVDITSDGQPCNLAPGATARLAIPVSAGADPGTPTIEIWSLDEATGKWVYEGDATRDNSGNPVVYWFDVEHFTAYNLDRPIAQATELTVTVTDGENVVSGATVVVTSTSNVGAAWEGRAITGADGKAVFAQIPQGQVQITATKGNLLGKGYGYDYDNGQATAEVALVRVVEKTITIYRMVNGVKTPVAGANVWGMAEGGNGHLPFEGVTGANGKITFQLMTGAGFYMVNANITVDNVQYSAFANANSVSALPSQLTLVAPGP